VTISIVTRTDFAPTTFEAARRQFAKKAAMTSDDFARLTASAKQRAFRVATVNKARLIQRVRDAVETAIATGEPWPTLRRRLATMFDSQGVPLVSLPRLRQMFRLNAQQAYNDARREVLDDPEITVAFPFRMYQTVGNGTAGVRGVRPEHAALHGLVFAWDDPFWDAHTPPWDYGCRCTMVALTAGQVKRMGKTVHNLGYVRRRVRVTGRKKRGIAANPNFPRGALNLEGLADDLRKKIEAMI